MPIRSWACLFVAIGVWGCNVWCVVATTQVSSDRLYLANTFDVELDDSADPNVEGSAAMSILRGKMDPRLLHALQFETPEFATPPTPPSNEEFHKLGFSKCQERDHPKTHLYHEGYFHGAKTSRNITALHPRNGGNHQKPPAPKILRAFLASFRELNKAMFATLLKETNFLPDVPDAEFLFCDVAVQSHYGTQIKITEDGATGWHYDSANSLLHLSLTLHGTRYLHYTGDSIKYFRDQLQPGDIYLTCPHSFFHAVEYPGCNWGEDKESQEQRILAIQVRILFDSERFANLMSKTRKKNKQSGPASDSAPELDLAKSITSVANWLSNDGADQVRIPKMDDIYPMLERLEEIERNEKEEEEAQNVEPFQGQGFGDL